MDIHSLIHFHIYKPRKDLLRLFWAGVVRHIAISFLWFFSAIYIFSTFTDLGYSLRSAIYAVCLFYILVYGVKHIFLAISEDLSRKIGFLGVIKLSLIPYILLILSLLFTDSYPFVVFIAGVFWGIHAGLYWWGYHGYFIKVGDAKRFGAGIGEQEFIRTASTILAPFLGAIVISRFGFSYIFVLSAIFMTVSVLIISFSQDIKQKHDVTYLEIWRLILKHKSISLAYISGGMEGASYMLAWPLFLYTFFGDILNLGEIVSLSLLLSAFLGVFIGESVDKSGERMSVILGTPLFAFSWLLRAFGFGFVTFVIADSMRNFADKLVTLPLTELTYKKAVEDYIAKAILFREMTLGVGAILAVVIVAIIVSLDLSLRSSFYVVSVVSFFPIFAIIKRKI